VPGPSGSRPAWGELPLLIDTSAWSRAHHPAVRERWIEALEAGRLRVSPIARLEILLSARSGKDFDTLAERLTTLRTAPLTPAVARAAEDAMRTLAHRSAGAQRIPIADYLLAAAAQELGAAVIHYDHDYDTLAEVMTFESIWLAPRGSLP
jgi:predicted nucleic acid-binding protein